jgi:hypothetical protein
MNRVKRRLFNAVAPPSLLLSIAATALWARSYRRFDELRIGREQAGQIASDRGRMAIMLTNYPV